MRVASVALNDPIGMSVRVDSVPTFGGKRRFCDHAELLCAVETVADVSVVNCCAIERDRSRGLDQDGDGYGIAATGTKDLPALPPCGLTRSACVAAEVEEVDV